MRNLICGIVSTLTVVALAIAPAFAQTSQKVRKTEQKSQSPPVAIVNNPLPEYRSGEVSVAVRGNENPIIRLGLAQNGVTLVEFPAADRFFAINPGSGDLVTVEDSPTKETDHFFVIRPASVFWPPADGSKALAPATSIVVQMSSGMVVTFLLYPVRDIERNAHRCVVTYDREAIIKARQAAGLAINIDRRADKSDSIPAAASLRFAPPVETVVLPAIPATPQKIDTSENEKRVGENPKSLLDDATFPDSKEKWSKRLHGLKIAVRTEVIDAGRHQVLVAVRNTLSKPVTIVPGYPELYIHTLDDKGRVLLRDSVKHVKVECASPKDLISPGETVRYLLTYEPPILGAKQRLGVAVAQTSAADDPVTMELTAGTR